MVDYIIYAKLQPITYDLEAWHKILGHCNKGDVENLEKVV